MGTLATLLAVCLLLLGACGQSDDGVCLHYITGEPIAQVRDADGTLWDVERQPYRPYPDAGISEGCAIPIEARLETGGMPHIIEYQDDDGQVIHSRSVPGTWALHAESGEYVAIDPLLPDEALILVDYRWHRPSPVRLTARQLPLMVLGAQIQDAPMVREPMARKTRYATAYDAGYAEIHAALDEIDHPADCGHCRPCEVMGTALEWTMRGLSRKLDQDEFYTLARILAKAEGAAGGEWRGKPPKQTTQ